MSALNRFPKVDALDPQAEIDTETMKLVPDQIIHKHGVVPLRKDGSKLFVAAPDPLDVVVLDDLSFMTGCDIVPVETAGKDIEELITRYFGIPEVKKALLEMDEVNNTALDENPAADSPVIQIVNSIILKAVHEEASDIHIEPFKEEVLVRFRVDGVLHRRFALPRQIIFPLVSRIKVMANLDITERRLPLDGHIPLKLNNYDLDLRVSTVPTIFGEKVVLRIFDKENIKKYDLENIGFSAHNYELMQSFLSSPFGLLLVTGPTGSGKTTTLYTALKNISCIDKNIVTVEDPVEYVLEGVNQTQINSKAGASFATYLRSILRQDPDVIMIGEIRDLETAQIAVRAATTGHLVLSTMHTNDAPGALTRLIDMGVEPFMVASSVLGVISQRLVRRVCPSCQEKRHMNVMEKTMAGVFSSQKNVRSSKGCGECNHTGYRGRAPIHEILKVSASLQNMILQRASTTELRNTALAEGMISIKEDGICKSLQGITTIQEVMRVTGEEEEEKQSTVTGML
jgi:type IV pilus assembly protein PilB